MIFKIEDEKIKERYLAIMRDSVKIPICKKCGKLFSLGFPKTEKSISDFLICDSNNLVCHCENFKRVEELYKSGGNSNIDIKNFYE